MYDMHVVPVFTLAGCYRPYDNLYLPLICDRYIIPVFTLAVCYRSADTSVISAVN